MRLAVFTVLTVIAVSGCGGAEADSGGVASVNGGGQASASASAASASDLEQGRKFAQCMRDHGVPDFPDPDPNGGFSGAVRGNRDDTATQKALVACRDLLPAGRLEALQDPKNQEKLRVFAQCMRDLGYEVQDPDPNDPTAMFKSLNIDRNDPKVQKDIQTCQDKSGSTLGGGQ